MNASRRLLLTVLKLVDLAIVTASFVVGIATAMEARHPGSWRSVLDMSIQLDEALFVAVYIGFWHFVLKSRGLYQSYRLSGAARETYEIGAAVLGAVAPLVPFKLIFDFRSLDSVFLSTFAACCFLGLVMERRVLRAIGRRARLVGRNLRHVIVVGGDRKALALASRLSRHHELGYHVLEVITASAKDDPDSDLAVLQRVEKIIDEQPVDEIFLALPLDASQPLVRELISVCEEEGITIRVLAQVASLYWARAVLDAIEGQPVLTLYTGPPDSLQLLAKRAIDIFGALVGLILFGPLFALVALLIKLDSAGPVFFRQERVGLNRRHFKAFKFRTMVDHAEQMQAKLESLNEASGPVFKITNDPRVTRVGKWLRRTSIDELPQLLNVLSGEMSLVGPRPLPLRDVSRIDVRWHKRRFSVKPGITCLWQVNSREPRFDEWIQWDMEYIDNWSLGLDLKILFKTIPAVLSGQGVH